MICYKFFTLFLAYLISDIRFSCYFFFSFKVDFIYFISYLFFFYLRYSITAKLSCPNSSSIFLFSSTIYFLLLSLSSSFSFLNDYSYFISSIWAQYNLWFFSLLFFLKIISIFTKPSRYFYIASHLGLLYTNLSLIN